jgi:hypothetical protein
LTRSRGFAAHRERKVLVLIVAESAHSLGGQMMFRPWLLLVLSLVLARTSSAEDDAAGVRAFFEEYVRRGNAFDPTLAELYSPDARIRTLRDGTKPMEMNGAQWKELIAKAMPIAKKRGDSATFESLKLVPQDDAYRINASRTSALKCVADPNFYLIVKRIDARWQIVEEYSETVSLSRCPPSEALAQSLDAMARGLRSKLPLDLDADTRLESVEVIGPALVYHQRLHTITAAEMDLSKLQPMLQQLGVQFACGPKEMRALIDAGATVRYSYVDRDGAVLGGVDISPGLCP